MPAAILITRFVFIVSGHLDAAAPQLSRQDVLTLEVTVRSELHVTDKLAYAFQQTLRIGNFGMRELHR